MEYQAIATSGGDVIILLAPNTESLKIWVISKLHTKASRSPNYDVDGDITEGAGGCGGSFGHFSSNNQLYKPMWLVIAQSSVRTRLILMWHSIQVWLMNHSLKF